MLGVTTDSGKPRTPISKRNSSLNTAKKKRRKKHSAASSDSDLSPTKSRHYAAPMDKKLLFQDITNEFAEWTSWQRRMLLCKVTEKTSSTLLSTLSTVLEPIFHRDFDVKSKNGFDSSLIQTFSDSKRNSLTSYLPSVPSSRGSRGLSLIPIFEPPTISSPEGGGRQKRSSIDISIFQSNADDDTAVPFQRPKSRSLDTTSSLLVANFRSLSPCPSRSRRNSAHRPLTPRPSGDVAQRPVSPRPSTKANQRPISPRPMTNSSQRPISPRPVTNSSRRSTSPTSSQFSPDKFIRMSRKEMGKKSVLREADIAALTNLAEGGLSNVLKSRGTGHDHEDDCYSSSLSTLRFVLSAQKQKMDKLGTLLKPGATQKNGLTSVRQYKPQKLWLPPLENGGNLELTKPSKTVLMQSFKMVMEDFLDRYVLWSNAEKGDFLLHVVDHCQPDEIKFLANCIYQRIESISDINSLNDDLLLKILSYLSVDDLSQTVQVNKRWLELSTCSDIWEKNCFRLAVCHDQVDVMKSLESSAAELDWKQIYGELKSSIEYLAAVKAQKEEKENQLRQLQVPTPALGASWQDVSEGGSVALNESQNMMGESQNTLGRQTAEESTIAISVPSLIGNASRNTKVSVDVEAVDEIPPLRSEIADNGIHSMDDHVRFCMEKNESTLQVMLGSIDRMAEDYAFEEDLLKKVTETVQEEDKQDQDKDVAFDVRQRLIQAADRLAMKNITEQGEGKEKDVSEDEEEEEEDYQLMQITNVRTINRVRKLEGHLDSVLCLQFDSKRVVTGSSDRSVRLWDTRSGRCFQTLVGHQGGIRCLQFDEKYIVTGSWDTTVIVWDVINFELICTIVEHSDCVSCLELTPDTLITGSFDATICIFEKHTWVLLTRLTEHTGPVSCMCLISPSELLTGSHDKSLRLWDLDERRVRRSFDVMKSPCLCVKVCGDLVTAGCSDGTVTFWELSSGSVQGCISVHTSPVNALCFVHTRFYTAGGDVVKEWDLSTCACLRSLRGHSGTVYCVRASAKRIVSGSGDATTRIWDMASKLQQVGRNYDELNKNIIPAQVVNEHQYKKMIRAK